MWVVFVDMWISFVDNMFVRWRIRVNISIISIGKLKEKYLKQGIAEYLKRLSAYAKVEVIELPDEKAPENLSEAEMLIVKEKEGIRILDKISDDTCDCISYRRKAKVIRRIRDKSRSPCYIRKE